MVGDAYGVEGISPRPVRGSRAAVGGFPRASKTEVILGTVDAYAIEGDLLP